MTEVREGTVNGLPCFRIVRKVWYDHEYQQEAPVWESGPWMVGLPDWWPHPPSVQCPECGYWYGEDPDVVGHVCPALDQPEDEDLVARSQRSRKERSEHDRSRRSRDGAIPGR